MQSITVSSSLIKSEILSFKNLILASSLSEIFTICRFKSPIRKSAIIASQSFLVSSGLSSKETNSIFGALIKLFFINFNQNENPVLTTTRIINKTQMRVVYVQHAEIPTMTIFLPFFNSSQSRFVQLFTNRL